MQFQHINPSRDKALKLALLLGWAGMHRFYTHQMISGFAYLLFSWTLIPVVLSLIDAAFLARMTDDEFSDEFCPLPESLSAAPLAAQVKKTNKRFDLTA